LRRGRSSEFDRRTAVAGHPDIRFFGRARDDNNWTFDGVDATGIKDPPTGTGTARQFQIGLRLNY
jgi:hypothetical protein